MRKIVLIIALLSSCRMLFAQPAITILAVTATTGTTATIQWTTSTPATSQLLYGIGVLNQQTPTIGTLTTSHTITLSGLTPGVVWFYAAVSVDGGGGSTTSSTQQFELCDANATVNLTGTVNNYYQYGSYTLTWENNSGYSISPTVCGQALTTTVTGALDGGASFSLPLANSLEVVPSPNTWQIVATDVGNLSPVTVNFSLTAVSRDLTPQLQAGAASAGLTAVIANTINHTFYPPISGGSGTVTHTTGALTDGDFVLGNGGGDVKADPNISDNGTAITSTVPINAPEFANTFYVGGFPSAGGTWMGNWDNTGTFPLCSAVVYNSLNYVATAPSSAASPVTPGTNPLYWYPEPYTLTDGTFIPTQFDCAFAYANAQATANPLLSYLLVVGQGQYSKCGNGEFAHAGRGTVSLVGAGRNTTNISQNCYSVEHYTASVTNGTKIITTTSPFPFQYGDIVDNDTGFSGIPPHSYVTATPTVAAGVTTLTINNNATATNANAPLIWGAPEFRHLPDPTLSSSVYMEVKGMTLSTDSYTLGCIELDGLNRSIRSDTYCRDAGYNPQGISSGFAPVGNYPSVLIGNGAFNGGYSLEMGMDHNSTNNYPTVSSGSPQQAQLVAFVSGGSVTSVAVGREYTANVTSGSNTLTITSTQTVPTSYVGFTVVNGNGFAGIPSGATITSVTGGNTIVFSGSPATANGTSVPIDILTPTAPGAIGNYAYNAATVWFLGTTSASPTLPGGVQPCTTMPTGTANLVANGDGTYSVDVSNPVTITNNGGGTCQNDVHVQMGITIPQDYIYWQDSMSDSTDSDEVITGGANIAAMYNRLHGGNSCIHCHVFNQGSEFINYGLKDDNGGLVMVLFNSDSINHAGILLDNNKGNLDVFEGWSKYWSQGNVYPGSVDMVQLNNAPVFVDGAPCGDNQYWGGYHQLLTATGPVDQSNATAYRAINSQDCGGSLLYGSWFSDAVYIGGNHANGTSLEAGSNTLYFCGSHWVAANSAPERNCANMTYFAGGMPVDAEVRINGPENLLDMGITQWTMNLINPIAADGTNNYPGPMVQLRGSVNGSGGVTQDLWQIKPIVGATGTNPYSVIDLHHTGAATSNTALGINTIIGDNDANSGSPFGGYLLFTEGNVGTSAEFDRPIADGVATLELRGESTGAAAVFRSSGTGQLSNWSPTTYIDNGGTPNFGVENLNATQQTTACSTAGSVVQSQPERGSSYKMVVVQLIGCNGSASFGFTVAFAATPAPLGLSNLSGVTLSPLNAASVQVNTTGVTNGYLLLVGN